MGKRGRGKDPEEEKETTKKKKKGGDNISHYKFVRPLTDHIRTHGWTNSKPATVLAHAEQKNMLKGLSNLQEKQLVVRKALAAARRQVKREEAAAPKTHGTEGSKGAKIKLGAKAAVPDDDEDDESSDDAATSDDEEEDEEDEGEGGFTAAQLLGSSKNQRQVVRNVCKEARRRREGKLRGLTMSANKHLDPRPDRKGRLKSSDLQLTGEIVDRAFDLLRRREERLRLDQPQRPLILFTNCYFVRRLLGATCEEFHPDLVSAVLQAEEVQKADKIFIPTLVGTYGHFVLIVADPQNKTLDYYEPYQGIGLGGVDCLAPAILNGVMRYLLELTSTRRKFKLRMIEGIPRQSKTSDDCGVYVVAFGTLLAFGIPIKQSLKDLIDGFRPRLAANVLACRLHADEASAEDGYGPMFEKAAKGSKKGASVDDEEDDDYIEVVEVRKPKAN